MQDTVRKTEFIRDVPDAPSDPDAFLEWSSRQPRGRKYELSRGRVIEIMINVRRRHAVICTNLMAALLAKLEPGKFNVTVAEFAVRTNFGIRGPDVLVEPINPDLDALASADPIFLAEVLSPSTVAIDFTDKVEEYTSIPSLSAYLICSQDMPIVWLLAREHHGGWPKRPAAIQGRDASVGLPGLGIELAMSAIYQGIPDPPQP